MMNSKILHLTLSSLAILLWLFLYTKGIRRIPYTDDMEQYKSIYQFIPIVLIVFIYSIFILFEDRIRRYFKTESIQETKLMRIRARWGLMIWVVTYTIAMIYIVMTGRYHRIFNDMIFPIFLLFIGNFMPLTPFNNFDVFTTKETCSSEAIWKRVFCTRGIILSIAGIILLGIIIVQPRDAMWYFYFIVAIFSIVGVHTWLYSKYLYRKERESMINK